MIYFVGKARRAAICPQDALRVAVEMLEDHPIGDYVMIRSEKGVYSWVEVVRGVDRQPHTIYFKPSWKYGKPISSECKVITRGTRWTKTRHLDAERAL